MVADESLIHRSDYGEDIEAEPSAAAPVEPEYHQQHSAVGRDFPRIRVDRNEPSDSSDQFISVPQIQGVPNAPWRQLKREVVADPTVRQYGESSQRYAGLVQEAGLLRAEGAKKEAQALQEAQQFKMESLAKEEEWRRQEQEAIAEAKRGWEDAELSAKYGGMDPEEIRAHRENVNDPNLPPGIRAQSKDALDSASSVDPNRLFGSAGGRIQAALSLVFSSIGASILGTPDRGMQVINDAINRDIESQQERFRKSRKAALGAKDLYAQRVSAHGDERRARLETMNARYQAILDKVNVAKASAKTQQEVVNAEALGAQVEMNAAKVQSELLAKQRAERAGIQAQISQNQRAAQAAQAQVASSVVKAIGKKQKAKIIGSADTRAIGEFNAGVEAADKLLGTFDDKTGKWSILAEHLPWRTKTKEYNDERRASAQVIGGILEGGKLTDADFDRYYDMLPDATDSNERAANKIRVIKNLLRGKSKASLEAFGAAGYEASGLAEVSRERTQEELGSGIRGAGGAF